MLLAFAFLVLSMVSTAALARTTSGALEWLYGTVAIAAVLLVPLALIA